MLRRSPPSPSLDMVLGICFVVFGYGLYLLWGAACFIAASGFGYLVGTTVLAMLEAVLPW